MPLAPDDYMRSCRERLEVARRLYEGTENWEDPEDRDSCHLLSAYLSGVAVECMLRAFVGLRTNEFDSRHDLKELARDSGYVGMFPRKNSEIYASELTDLWRRWKNSHRYYSKQKLLAEFRKSGIDPEIKGNRLKFNAKRCYEAAERLIGLGEERWKTRTSNKG